MKEHKDFISFVILAIAVIINGLADIRYEEKTTRTMKKLRRDIEQLQDHNAALQDDIQCLRHNANDKVFPCVSTVGVSNYE